MVLLEEFISLLVFVSMVSMIIQRNVLLVRLLVRPVLRNCPINVKVVTKLSICLENYALLVLRVVIPV